MFDFDIVDGTRIVSNPIGPDNVDTNKHFFDAFGHYETEVSAHYLVLLAKEKGFWAPFTYEEINALYQRCGHNDSYIFNNLITGGWINQREDTYYFTLQFVARVWGSSPKT